MKKRTEANIKIENDTFNATLNGVIEAKVFTGKASAQSPSLKQTMAWLSPAAKPLGMAAVLKLDANGDVRCGTSYCDISKLDVSLDKINAKGQVKIAMVEKQAQYHYGYRHRCARSQSIPFSRRRNTCR